MLKKFYGLFLILIILMITFRPSRAANYYQIGVKVGDTADYEAKVTYNNNTRLHVCVHGIVGTVVTLNLTYYNKTGQQQPTIQVEGDMYYGIGYPYILCLYLITANLQKGDPIYYGASIKITDNVPMNVAGASRAINRYNDPTYSPLDIYCDQATGIMIKLNVLTFLGWENLTLTSTSLWSSGGGGVPLFVILLIGGIILFVVGMIAGFFIGRRGKEKIKTKGIKKARKRF